jgi:hypothetical protein
MWLAKLQAAARLTTVFLDDYFFLCQPVRHSVSVGFTAAVMDIYDAA